MLAFPFKILVYLRSSGNAALNELEIFVSEDPTSNQQTPYANAAGSSWIHGADESRTQYLFDEVYIYIYIYILLILFFKNNFQEVDWLHSVGLSIIQCLCNILMNDTLLCVIGYINTITHDTALI